jgi:hypothetical protein
MMMRLTRKKLTRVALSVMAGMLMLAAASDGYAAPQVGGAGVNPRGAIILVGKSPGGRFFGSPTTIKPPPSPRVRDHRGEQQKLKPPPNYCFRGGCRVPKGAVVRDHRSK